MSDLSTKVVEAVKNVGVRTVYGDPVELDDVTLIPVAVAQFGFGVGSSDESQGNAESASGGGGGGMSVPIGAYVRDAHGVRFEPNVISLLAVGIPFVCVAGRALSRIIRALKK